MWFQLTKYNNICIVLCGLIKCRVPNGLIRIHALELSFDTWYSFFIVCFFLELIQVHYGCHLGPFVKMLTADREMLVVKQDGGRERHE